MGKKAFILIFSLWVLALLTVLAVSIASGVRQKITLAQKLDERSRMRYLMESTAVKVKEYVRLQVVQAGVAYTPLLKMNVHNNASMFQQMKLDQDAADVAYTFYDDGFAAERFGVVDEERKININTTNALVLGRLLEKVLGIDAQESSRLARSILDWRQPGTSEAGGFFSDEYYSNLQYPFRKKDSFYDVLDEILLVKGVNKDIYDRILPYVTIYGNGAVNINTAPAAVLYGLGLEEGTIAKILQARRGQDGVEGTLDDHVFSRTFDVATEVNALVRLELAEIRSIEALNLQGSLAVISQYFTMNVQGRLAGKNRMKNLRGVFSVSENRMLYWKEK